MHRLRAIHLPIIAIIAVAGLIAWQAGRPRQLVSESGSRDPLPGIATSEAGQATTSAGLLTLLQRQTTEHATTETPTSTPTRTPRPPTMTPRPTWGPQTTMTPGRVYLIPKWSPTPIPANIDPTIVPCDRLSPQAVAVDCGLPA